MSTSAAGSDSTQLETLPVFQTGFFGYDRQEVDEFLNATAADRDRLQQCLARLDALIVDRQSGRCEDVLSTARRQADEIRAAAEQEARRIVRDAESQAEFIQCERLQASRRELERFTAIREDVAHYIEDAVTTLAKTRESLAQRPAPPVATASISATDRVHTNGRGALRWISFAGAWLLVVIALVTLMMLVGKGPEERTSDRPATPPAAEAAPETTPSPAPKPAADARPNNRTTISSSSAVAAPRAVTAPPVTRRTASAPDASGLVVTLTANQECWISTSIDGGEARERLLQPSQTIVLRADEELTLKAGNAAALSMLINDEPAAPLGGERRVVTRRITRANYRNLLASVSQAPLVSMAHVQ